MSTNEFDNDPRLDQILAGLQRIEANLDRQMTPRPPATITLTGKARRDAAALAAVVLSGPVALGVAIIVAVALLTACGAPSAPSPQTSGPDPTPTQTCREAAREAFSALISDTPTVTPDEAQQIVDDGCSAVSPTDRAVIVDSERTAASARYLETQAP